MTSEDESSASELQRWVAGAVPLCEYWSRVLGHPGTQCHEPSAKETEGRWLCEVHTDALNIGATNEARLRWHHGFPYDPADPSEEATMTAADRGKRIMERESLGF